MRSKPTVLGRRTFLGTLPLAAALAGCRRSVPPVEAVFRIALPYEVDSVDPHVTSTTAAFTVLGNVFEPLVFTHSGQGLRPGLAERWSSPDPQTWVFELRPGVRFHSGRPVEAKDVVYSYRRGLLDPSLEVEYYLGEVAEVEALGPLRVRVRVHRRTPVLLYKLAHVFVIPEGSAMAQQADGTGPYRVLSWQPGRSLVLARNENYWGGLASVPRAEFRLHVPPAEVEEGLVAGTFQMALLGLARQRERLEPSPHHRLQRRTGLQVKYLSCDVARRVTPFCPVQPNPFRDRRVREAIHVGIDRARIVSQLPVHAVPATQLVPREVFGFAPDLPEIAHQPERARSLLRQAGLADGFRATLHTREILQEAAELVREELRGLGIQVQVEALPDATLFAGLKRREFSLWLDRWSCTTGDSGELFENAIHTVDAQRGMGSFNEAGFSDPRLDRAIRETLELEEPPERRGALEDLMRQVMVALPWIPLYTDEEVWALERAFNWSPRVDFWLHLEDIRPPA